MFKGICITGLDGNFASKASLAPSQISKTSCVLEFDDEMLCNQFLQRNRLKLYQMSVALPEESPKTFIHTPRASQDYQEMREFSFGKSTPAEDDQVIMVQQREEHPDSGSSPNLNIFYARTQPQQAKTNTVIAPQILIKEEPMTDIIKTEQLIKHETLQPTTTNYRTVLKTCRATSYLIQASFREAQHPSRPQSVFRPKQKKKLRKMLFTTDDLMFLASQLQTKNKIQSFKLVKPSQEHAEIMCTKCDAKVVFSQKRDSDEEQQRFRMSHESVLSHELEMHPEFK